MKRILLVLCGVLCSLTGAARNEKYVNLFLGSSGDHGQVTPGAAVPFGMISVCPDSRPGQHGGYDYAVAEIAGVSINRISGVGCGGTGGNLSIRPGRADDTIRIVKGTERARPGYYAARFDNGTAGEFTATHNTAVERFAFGRDAERALHVDFRASFEGEAACSYRVTDNRTIEGFVEAPTACARGRYKLWFVFRSDTPFDVAECDAGSALLLLPERTRQAEIRIAVSPIDGRTAREELDAWSDSSFEQLRRRAGELWRERLDKIDVKGGLPEHRVIFYTSLYRSCLSPADVTSRDGRYLGTDGKIYRAEGFRYYSSWSLWDTFRTKFPLLTLTEPELMRDFANSLLHLYRTGKRNWATPCESTPTVRTEHAVILLLDAWCKGIDGLDFDIAYERMKYEADHETLTRSVDQKMEAAYDLWALERIARIAGNAADAEAFRRRADSLFESTWRSEFMEITPEFERMGGNGLYQGTRWQYRWAAPQYVDRMIEWVGRDTLCNQLSRFFERDMYNQGNEPDIHVPFLFNRFGRPDLSQRTVRRLMTEACTHRYGGSAEYPEPFFGCAFRNHVEGYCPEMDEDDGTMSAWYVFGAMGFYPLLVGSDRYELTSPIFDRVVLHIGGKPFAIRTEGRKSPDDIVSSILLNGRPLAGYELRHEELMHGGELVFRYGAE